ncbi:MAG: imidazole glycerol phosphate synthase subunit HisH [Rudaea sp.]
MRKVILVDAGGTNIGSVRYALQRLGVDASLSAEATEIRSASHVILPGVGAAAPGMKRLRDSHLVDVIRALTQPVLGVCLGMQLLFARSEESDTECLGIIPADVRRLQSDGVRVPHMGWNMTTMQTNNRIMDETDSGYAYYVHSYAAPVGDFTVATSTYGELFSAIVQRDNFFGVQFHPERSASLGAKLLSNFLAL